MFNFNHVLAHHELNPATTRLVRHDHTGAAALARGLTAFESFVSFQTSTGPSPFNGASHIAHFVAGPRGDDGRATAVFISAHRVVDEFIWQPPGRNPVLYAHDVGYSSKPGCRGYDLEVVQELREWSRRIVIGWGSGTRSWSQWAGRNEKQIVELRREIDEPQFPGFRGLQHALSELVGLPDSWKHVLASVTGVYLMVCPDTGAQYVGSAYGADGIWGRWLGYIQNGHGGNIRLRERGQHDYAMSILEIASPDMSAADIIAREGAWKEKLGVRAFGLNAN